MSGLFVIVLLLYASVLAYDLCTAPNEVSKRTKAVYFSLMLISFVLLVLHSLDVSVPSPSDAITHVLDALFPIQS
ncbi:MAG: hypothetical protein VB099_18490 [Candidatus Limiplasma sp.]|nr:hypothetical protein [Candidatus Limiplasma sp.]